MNGLAGWVTRCFVPLLTVAFMLTSAATSMAQTPVAQVSTRDAPSAMRLINTYRAGQGLGALRLDPRLSAAAASHARAMAAAGALSHDIGVSYAARMQRLGLATASENLGYGYAAVTEAVAAWRASPAHDANLRKPALTRMGLARATTRGGRPYWALILAR